VKRGYYTRAGIRMLRNDRKRTRSALRFLIDSKAHRPLRVTFKTGLYELEVFEVRSREASGCVMPCSETIKVGIGHLGVI